MTAPKAHAQRRAIVRTCILAHIRTYRPASLKDLCREFAINEAEAAQHLRVLRIKRKVHRVSPFDCPESLGQIWTVGKPAERGPGSTFIPIQVTVKHWAGDAHVFRRTTLEHLLCFERPKAEAV